MTENNPNYYSIIPAEVRYCEDLTPNAKLLYGEITALANKSGYCWASNSYFANLYKVSERIISEWVKQLAEKGFIENELLDKYKRKIFVRVGTNLLGGRNKSSRGVGTNLLHNNTFNNTSIKKDFSKEKSPSFEEGSTTNIKEVKTDDDGVPVEIEVSRGKKTTPAIKKINLKFRELCEKNVGQKPTIALGKQGAIIKSALRFLSEEDIYDLFDWWFSEQNKPDHDLIQITQALSTYNIDKYKMEHDKD